MRNTFLKAVLPVAFALALASCSNDSTEASIAETPNTEIVQNYTYNADELILMDEINQYRTSIGKSTLQTINHISYKSEEHTEYMIAMNAINHDNFEERSQNLVDVLAATRVSENVAYNYATPESVLHAWLASDGHKKNIEGDYTHFGVSIKVNPDNGNKYYTNIFIKK